MRIKGNKWVDYEIILGGSLSNASVWTMIFVINVMAVIFPSSAFLEIIIITRIKQITVKTMILPF